MAGGFFLKTGVGLLIMSLFVYLGAFFLTDMGNAYDISVSDLDEFESQREALLQLQEDKSLLSDESTINQESFGDAQFEGGIAQERENLKEADIYEQTLDSFTDLVPLPNTVIQIILGIIAAFVLAAGFYVVLGRFT